ncbi:MAG: response regulator [Candidatus Micrarchaeota archaeon]
MKETGATEIVTARDVADAMTILQSDRNFDVIVCDLDMPGGNALKLIEQMKQTEIQIPVIVFSGGFLSATPEKILEAGALTVFEKGSESRLNDMIVRITGIINN